MKIGFINNKRYIKSLFNYNISLEKAKNNNEKKKMWSLINKKKKEAIKIIKDIEKYFFETVEEIGKKDTIIILESEVGKKTKKLIEKMGKRCETEETAYQVADASDCIILFFDRLAYSQNFVRYSEEFNIIKKALDEGKTIINLCKDTDLSIKVLRERKKMLALLKDKEPEEEETEIESYECITNKNEFTETKDIFKVLGTEEDPDPYHHPLTSFERMIFEAADFDYKGGEVLTVHEITDTKPYYFKINYIKNKTKCLPSDAERLAELFEYFNLSEKIVFDFINTINAPKTKTQREKELFNILEDLGDLQKRCIEDEEKTNKEPEGEEIIFNPLENLEYSIEPENINFLNEEIENSFHQKADLDSLEICSEEEIDSIYEGGFQPFGFHVDDPFSKVPKGYGISDYDIKVQEGKYSRNPLVQNLKSQIKNAVNFKEVANIRKKIYKLQSGKAKTTAIPLSKNDYMFLWKESKAKKGKLEQDKILALKTKEV